MAENSDPSQQRPEQHNLWFLALAVLFLVYYFIKIGAVTQDERVSYSEFIDKVELQQVQSVVIQGLNVRGNYISSGLSGADGGVYVPLVLVKTAAPGKAGNGTAHQPCRPQLREHETE